MRAHRTRILFGRARRSVAALWTLLRNIRLNSRHYSYENTLQNPYLLSILVHEVCHLQQGFFTALSVYGELQAWQLQFRLYQRLTERPLGPAVLELLSLPLDMDRGNLRRARALIRAHAGRGYWVHLLPLYPLRREIRNCLAGFFRPVKTTEITDLRAPHLTAPAQERPFKKGSTL